ncbi:CCXG family PEP-CTERM protein [Chitinivorax sp. B]|uniref:CCXG family PEP-CTERM protein n=1 Tax=Chitinivorax sp. B TaxID=2502235 RepID=UPI00148572CE|nr:CCXG family PEP-CTERM protein [Chitinivorax sp. B]
MGKTTSLLATAITLAVCFGATSVASASVISYQSRYSPAGNFATGLQYQSTIDGLVATVPTAGYCDRTISTFAGISNQAVCNGGSYRDIAFHYNIAFGVGAADAGQWSFRLGPDFGKGGAVFLDGVLLAVKNDDLWWNGNFNASGELLSTTVGNLVASNHTLDIYGFEGCCDGLQSAQFRIGNGQWTTFSGQDKQNRVPEPASIALFGAALIGLRISRRLWA